MSENGRRLWFDARQAGAYLKIPSKTLYSLTARGRLPRGSVIRIGRALRFDIAAIDEYLAVEGLEKGRRK